MLIRLFIKKLHSIVTELFIRKLNISLVFIMQSYFALPKNIRLNSTHYFIMKIQNKQELEQIAFNYSPEDDFQDKKCPAKLYYFLIIHATLASDNSLHFRKNILEKMHKRIITIDDKIRDERLQYDINRKAVKISALPSVKIDKYEYLTGEEILPSDQSKIIKQVKFTYLPLGKGFEKQTKTIEDKDKKQIKALEEHGKQLIMYSGEKDSLELLKQKKIDELVNERRFEINKLSERIDFKNLTYYYTRKSSPKYFVDFKGPLIIYNDAKNCGVSLQKEEKIQEEFRLMLNET